MTALANPASQLVDPAALTASQRDWLRRLSLYRHYRAPGGWRIRGEAKLCTLKMAGALLRLGLIRHHGACLVPTYSGRATLAIMDERIRARQARS